MSKEREPASGAPPVALRAPPWLPKSGVMDEADGRRNPSLQRFSGCCVGKTSKHSRANWA